MDQQMFAAAEAVREERREWQERHGGLLCKVGKAASDIRRLVEVSDIVDRQSLDEVLMALRGQFIEMLKAEGAELFGKPGDSPDAQHFEICEVRGPSCDPVAVLEVEREGIIWQSTVIEKALVVISETRPQSP